MLDHEAVFLASAIACDERSINRKLPYMNKVVAPTLMLYAHAVVSILFTRLFFETMPQ